MMAAERLVLLAELLAGAAAGGVFLVLALWGRWRTRVAWQLVSAAAVSTGELLTLAAVLSGWRPPWLVLIAGYAAVDVVMVRWVWLLLRTRNRGPGETRREEPNVQD